MCRIIRLFVLLHVMVLISACSSASVKRNAYQSVESMRQQQCIKQPSTDCPPPESYNKYEAQREEAIKK